MGNVELFNNQSSKPNKNDANNADNESWLSAFCDSAMDGIVILDEQQKIVRFNPAAEKIFLCQAQDVCGELIDSLIPALFREAHREYIQIFAETNKTRHKPGITKTIGLRKNGQEFPIEITISQFENDGKNFFAAILRDATERENAEKALRESEQRYRTLADAANDMIWIVNSSGRIEYVNVYAAQQLGKTPQQLIGKLQRDLFPDKTGKRQWKSLEKVIKTGNPTYVEWASTFFMQKIWLGTSLVPLRNDSGEVYAVLGVGRDITARKEAENTLQRHDAILEAVSSAAENFLQAENLEEHLQKVLAQLGEAAQASRVYIYENYEKEYGCVWSKQRFEWVSPGIKSQLENPDLQDIPLYKMREGRWLKTLSQGQSLHGYVDTLDESGRRLVVSQGILSVVAVPIFSGTKLWGFMGFDESRIRREWSAMEIQALKTAADILGAAIQREKAEGILRISEAEYRSLFENALEGIYRTSPDGHLLAANPALIKMLGFDAKQDLLSLDFSKYLYVRPENNHTVRQGQAEADELRNIELHLERQDGQVIIVLNNSRRVRDENGNILYYEGTMVDITERKQAVEQINRRVNELEALYESGLILGQSLDPKMVGEKVIDVLTERLNWDHAAVRLRHENSDSVELIAFAGGQIHSADHMRTEAHARAAIAHVSQGLVGWVLQNGQTIRVNNLEDDPRYVRTFAGMSSGLYVPMKIDGYTIGCISIESPEPDAFSESDERLVSTLSAQAAIAIENARLFKQTQRRLEQVSVLHQIDVVISSSADFHSTLKFVLEHILVQLKVDAAQVLLLDHNTMTLVFANGAGFSPSKQPDSPCPVQQSRAAQAILEHRPLFIPNLKEHEKGGPEIGFLPGKDFKMYGCVPLVSKGEIKGVLEVFNRDQITLTDEWMEFFQVLASQTAIAVDNSLMFEDLQRSNLELSLAYDATIEGWSRALDLRDKETEGHTQRVTTLSVRLAIRLGLSENEIVHLRRGGLLHDIGKMGVTDTILNKPGPLTEEEFAIMRQHPGYAYDMLMPISYLRPALDIPYSHHEKWDGSGYPLGLKGEQIPLVARIFAISDVFDALTSDRPYRTAWPVKKTLDYLKGQSGRHFDPKIVDAFLAMIIEDGNENLSKK